VKTEADPSPLQPAWLYVFAGAVVILAVGTLILLVLALLGFVHLSGEAMAGM
jgi:hypothetical protein